MSYQNDRITFWNNTDYQHTAVFGSKRAFLRFAKRYISRPDRWGNLYSQRITDEDGDTLELVAGPRGAWIDLTYLEG